MTIQSRIRFLQSSPLGITILGLFTGMLIVMLSRLALNLHRDESTPAELERVVLEVNSMQDEDEQVLDQLRISEESEDVDNSLINKQTTTEQFAIPDPDDPMGNGIHLITTYFHGSYSSERFEEIETCLLRNIKNLHIDKIHILYEGESPTLMTSSSKLILTKLSHQPTYTELFIYVNSVLKRGAIAIIANADVYFDDSLKCIKNVSPGTDRFNLVNPKTTGKRPFFGLTRRHAPECGDKPDYRNIFDLCDQYIGSHDAFVFAPPVSEIIVNQMNHTQNAGLGAENVVIWALNHSGEWRGYNPCDLIKAYHLHCSNDRTYSRIGVDHKLVFVSGKQFNGGIRKHGWIKTFHWRKTITCPYEFF